MANALRLLGRSWKRSPGFPITAVIVIAVGIGLCTAIISLVLSIVFPPVLYPRPEQLVEIWATSHPQYESPADYLVPERALAWEREPNRTLDGAALAGPTMFTLHRGEQTEKLATAVVSGEFFRTLGVRPVRGRFLTPEDDQPGAPPAAVLSYDAWQRVFHGDAGMLGSVVALSQRTFTIIGVMPRGFDYPQQTDVWLPLRSLPADRRPGGFLQIARVPAGVSLNSARAETLQRARAEFRQDSSAFARQGATLIKLGALSKRVTGTRLILLLSCALIVFVLANANLATLMLLRIARGWRDAGVRVALGATRGQLIQPIVLEAAVLSILGAAMGLLLAGWIAQASRVFLANQTNLRFVIDVRVLAVMLASTIITTVVLGLLPALRIRPDELQLALRDGAGGITARRSVSRARLTLLSLELALATSLGSAAIVLARSYRNYARLEIGYETQGVTLVELHDDPGGLARPAFESASELVQRLTTSQGFDAAAAWREVTPSYGARLEDQVSIGNGQVAVNPTTRLLRSYDVTPGFFDLLQVRVLRGRTFTPGDTRGNRPVAVVNQLAANAFWPGQDPIGQQIRFGGASTAEPWLTVVGVVETSALFNSMGRGWYLPRQKLNGQPQQHPLVYRSFAQSQPLPPTGWMVLFRQTVIGLRGGKGNVNEVLRNGLYTIDPDANVVFAGPMATWQMRGSDYNTGRTEGQLFAGFAVLALMIAVIGIYASVADIVRARRRELGIRAALGASSGDLFRLVARTSLLHAAFGTLAGCLVLMYASPLLTRSVIRWIQLVGVRWEQPGIVFPTSAALLFVAVVAAWRGAASVGRIDPAVALRAEQ